MDENNLDDLVHDAASNHASDINNEGLESQIRFLMDDCGMSSTSILKELGFSYSKGSGYTLE